MQADDDGPKTTSLDDEDDSELEIEALRIQQRRQKKRKAVDR